MATVISISNLTKTYRLYASRTEHAIEVLWPFGKVRHRDHHALRSVSFDVAEGESIGIVGRNGSGKSTLLKILAGVLSPTSGDVVVHGRVASLLELGAGFNPELTGRENVYFAGALMGATKAEIDRRIAQVIDFADIGQFIDQPVKIYSSGMFVRLAFSVSVHVDPDILIIDEALAVGDVRFQKKCIDFMRRLKESGKTILFVSHDIYTVKSFCTRLILIEDGAVEMIGDPDRVANRYHQIMFPKATRDLQATAVDAEPLGLPEPGADTGFWLDVAVPESDNQWGHGAAWIAQLRVGGAREPNVFDWGDRLVFELVCRWDPESIADLCAEQGIPARLLIGLRLENSQGWVLTNFASAMLPDGALDLDLRDHSQCTIRCTVEPLKLAAGHYFLSPGIAVGTQDSLFPLKEYANLVHLFCDTASPVMGQMRLDYDMELLAVR